MREQESYKQALPTTIKFNSDTLHLISTGFQDNIAQLIEDLETASKKECKATYSIGSKTNLSKSRSKKEDKRKEKGVLWLWKIERVEPLLFFFHWGRHQLMVNMSLRSMECHRSIMLI